MSILPIKIQLSRSLHTDKQNKNLILPPLMKKKPMIILPKTSLLSKFTERGLRWAYILRNGFEKGFFFFFLIFIFRSLAFQYIL